MSQLSQFFGGNSKALPLHYIIFNESANYIFPTDALFDVIVIGAGASGGAIRQGTYRLAGSGGGAGGTSKAYNLTAKKGDLISITIGVGGPPAILTSSTQSKNGEPGGTTIFDGLGRNLTAYGGEPGSTASTGSNTNLGLLGGSGGHASGGDINLSGSDGLTTDDLSSSGGGVSVDDEVIGTSSAGIIVPKTSFESALLNTAFFPALFYFSGEASIAFSGGNRAQNNNSSNAIAIAGSGKIGSGGGGAANKHPYENSSNTTASGRGGDGIVVLRIKG